MPILARIAVIVLLGASVWPPVLAQTADWATLNREVMSLYRQGRIEEAVTSGRQSLAAAERDPGPQQRNLATALSNLAGLHVHQSRLGDAEPLYVRLIALKEAEFGPEHPEVATAL